MLKKKVVRIQILGLSGFFERKQFIPIIFVLFLSSLYFGRDALRKVIYKSIELVENRNDTFLFGNRWNRKYNII